MSLNDCPLAAAPSSAGPLSAACEAAPETTVSPFGELGLRPELLQAVADLGYTQPTAVQQRVLPLALAGCDAGQLAPQSDLMVSSQTGSGKTAAFLLPVLQQLLQQQTRAAEAARLQAEKLAAEALARGEAPPKKPRRKNPTNPRNFKPAEPGALVLCPTRELAQQVMQDAIALVKHARGLRIASVIGGLPYGVQIARLQNANLVVATPGRLLDLQRSGQLKLHTVHTLVLDEADRMLDLGFAEDLAEIHQLCAQRQQTLMFSATFAPQVRQLALRVMRAGEATQQITIDTPQQRHSRITQKLYWADHAAHKRALLDHWLRDPAIDQAIVFASTQIECDALANDLQQAGFAAVALHGALPQGLRNRRLGALRDGRVQFLIATDVAARGIDVPTITHVFNYGLPMKPEDYTHRIGRTGRAGRSGLAITFAEWRDQRRMHAIEQHTRQPLQAEVIAGLEPRARPKAPARGRKQSFDGRPARSAPRKGARYADRNGHSGHATRADGSKRSGYARADAGYAPRPAPRGAASPAAGRRKAGGPTQRAARRHASSPKPSAFSR
ncbi:MAG: DEAD/DEAH box helicase [Brachymonas sp.]|nr:DEAD/DEAH box helicase [Brachymonas sp.]